MMDWKRCRRKQSWSISRYYPDICLDYLWKAMKKLMIAGVLDNMYPNIFKIQVRNLTNKIDFKATDFEGVACIHTGQVMVH
jgi:hypothetical protein